MRREATFVLTHSPYAVDLNGLTVKEHPVPSSTWDCQIPAVWFRRRQGRIAACVGHIWDCQGAAPASAVEFLERHTDGRYGGTCEGRWNGERYWGAQEPAVIEQHLALLRPMLDGFPAVPAGYDGWWTWHTPRTSGGSR